MARRARPFWAQVREVGECWLWTGTLTPNGYGRVKVAGEQMLAHRVAYDPVPCRTNLMRSPYTLARENHDKTHCARGGHPLSGSNLYVCPRGRRECRTCRNQAARRAKERG